jgi:hypothetical protein
MQNGNITVSKSKGFQMNGLPILITANNNAIDLDMTESTNKELFGQFMCASLCHEIFHNIASWIRNKTSIYIFNSSAAMDLALSTQNASARREIFTRFSNTVEVDGKKLDKMEKKRLVKKLCYISALSDNPTEIKKVENSLEHSNVGDEERKVGDDYADAQIAKWEKRMEKLQKQVPNIVKKGDKYNKNPKGYKLLHSIASGLTASFVGSVIGLPMLKLMPNKADAVISTQYHEFINRSNKEEYYCDMFAGMYNLPLSFAYGFRNGSSKAFVSNEISNEKLKKLDELEKNIRTYIMSAYPTDTERNYTAYKIAKQILESNETISPESKEYCEWIVKNYSNTNKLGMETHADNVFDASEANDLDRHVQELILNNGVMVTESYQMKKR